MTHDTDTLTLTKAVLVQQDTINLRALEAIRILEARLDRLEARLDELEHKAGPDRMWTQGHPQASGGDGHHSLDPIDPNNFRWD